MSEDNEGRGPGSAGFPGAALSLGSASASKADAYLDEQIIVARAQAELLRLQAEDLRREDTVRHWSLRIHHISDVLKLGFELAAAFVVTAIALVIGGAVWSAAHDNGLVIEAFNVPADMAASGLSGQVVATKVQDRLTSMLANTDTIRQANSFRNSWGDDIKVQIPDTGVSISELYRYLAGWLGHQTHITGEVWHTGDQLSLSVRVGSDAARTVSAPAQRFDDIVSKAAESVYAKTQPYRWSVYLDEQLGREKEAVAAARDLALNGPSEERAWGYTYWGLLTVAVDGKLESNLEKQRMAERLAPDLPNVAYNLAAAEEYSGHAEAALTNMQRAHVLYQATAARQFAAYAVAVQIQMSQQEVDELLGDYGDAQVRMRAAVSAGNYAAVRQTLPFAVSEDLARAHDIAGSQHVSQNHNDNESLAIFFGSSSDDPVLRTPDVTRALVSGDWAAARARLLALMDSPEMHVQGAATLKFWVASRLAVADAGLGDFAAAHKLIDSTPMDCYDCLRTRGDIATFERRWTVAGDWFAHAVHEAPSLPFAETDWGRMLMAKGDLDGAIATFEIAHKKGPHFADPLEMWGEALIAKNRSDLALVKFEEASKYAPSWGRLHLKWGEALWWAGNRDEAKKQFAIAAALNLTAAEKTELARQG